MDGRRIDHSRTCRSNTDLRESCEVPQGTAGSRFAEGCPEAGEGFRFRRSLRVDVVRPTVLLDLVEPEAQLGEGDNCCRIPPRSEWNCPGSAGHDPTDNRECSK